ncbi:hypothetical protein [Nitrincola alkalilacustris]|uniref:hypothetical protein n=1 Tax=Nitrincola alkalilacustris TaxID=1571224 RepID=UPI00124CA801|nr:hypothetical protein [Nitrincola alkalilacustris]
MKTKNLLSRLTRFLDADTKTQQKEIKSIRELLKKLKQKERDLKEKLDKRPDREDADDIRIKLDVIYAQRLKGLDRVKQLKEECKGKDKE